MKIDFTALDNIRRQKPANDTTKKDAPTDKASESDRAYSLLDAEAREREHMRQMYAEYQQAIRQSQELRAEIMHGIAAGKEPTALLLQAIQCISLITGDRAMYNTAAETIPVVYGYGLRNADVLARELAESQDRLAKLELAQHKNDLPMDSKRFLQTAIRENQAEIDRLELQLAAAD